jgi:aspartyl-tRNA(Asn)/glutamyl-tRNA(Gln) amidotransferase subunit A
MTLGPDLRSIRDVAPLLQACALSPVDLVRECLSQIECGRRLNVFTTVLADQAIEDAGRASVEIASGHYRGPLHGIPVAVKDLIDVSGTRTTAGSALPAPEAAADAPVIRRLRDAGAIIVGKTNLHEFAFGTTSEESAFGPVRNPRDESRSAGGSSGGSAAALAAGMCFGAVGTDTGGSIRIPSAACGTVGLKPSLGELPCAGIVPLSVTLDHVGPMARTVADAALLFQAMNGHARDSIRPRAGRITFGVPESYFGDLLEPGVRAALAEARRALAAAGHEVVELEIEHAAWTPDVYLHIVLPEAAWYHGPLLERHYASYSPEVRVRLEMGRYVLAEDYVRALRIREALTRSVDAALERCDTLLLATLPTAAPLLGARTVEVDGRHEPLRAAMLRLTQLFNVTGHPAIAVPAAASTDRLPRGLQLVGRRGATAALLETAAAVETYISGGPGSVGGGTG